MLTLFSHPQTVDQREHAACVGESSLRQSDAVEDQSDTVVQTKDGVWFSSLSGYLGRDFGAIKHAICSRGETGRAGDQTVLDIQTPVVFALSL